MSIRRGAAVVGKAFLSPVGAFHIPTIPVYRDLGRRVGPSLRTLVTRLFSIEECHAASSTTMVRIHLP